MLSKNHTTYIHNTLDILQFVKVSAYTCICLPFCARFAFLRPIWEIFFFLNANSLVSTFMLSWFGWWLRILLFGLGGGIELGSFPGSSLDIWIGSSSCPVGEYLNNPSLTTEENLREFNESKSSSLSSKS